MGWLTGRHPDDPDGLREPFPVSRHGVAGTTPLRSPLGMLLVGAGLELLALLLVGWAVLTSSAQGGAAMATWQLVALCVVLLVVPLPLLWMGAVRVSWQRRYTRVTGSAPVPYDD